MTASVAGDMIETLKETLGYQWDIMVFGLIAFLGMRALRMLQMRLEDLFYVQVLVGAPDEALIELRERSRRGGGRGGRRGGYHEEEEDPVPRSEVMAAEARAEEGKLLAEAVRKYAAFMALDGRNPLRYLFPLPDLRISTAIDSSTMWNDESDGTFELNATSVGVPLKTATVLPADGTSSVVVVEGVESSRYSRYSRYSQEGESTLRLPVRGTCDRVIHIAVTRNTSILGR